MEYYEKMKAIRVDNDLSQKAVADRLNIKQQQYSKYETGKGLIPITYLTEFCRAFGVSADYILGLPDDFEYIKR